MPLSMREANVGIQALCIVEPVWLSLWFPDA
jgi:hypothetical protein